MTHLTSSSPRTVMGFLQAIAPGSHNFKYMTPLYCFLLITGILAWRYRRNSFGSLEFALVNLLVYALVLYLEAFRIIEGGQFETALQVEKILYFFTIQVAALWLLSRYRVATVVFLTGLLVLSWGYALDRYYKRFPALTIIRSHFDHKFYAKQKANKDASRLLTFDRASGVRTSLQQAQVLGSVVSIVQHYTGAQDKIFVYPDMGSYYFFCERGFVGQFPVGTLAWMREDWHQGLMQSLNAQMPKVIVLK